MLDNPQHAAQSRLIARHERLHHPGTSPLRVLSGIMFYPRGGSAFVARAITRELVARGLDAGLLSGSRSDIGPSADASRFYLGLDPLCVDFTPSLKSSDPLAFEGPPWTAPIHPSFESRPGAPDRIFTELSNAEYQRQVRAWATCLRAIGQQNVDVLHLHHLTPIHSAATAAMPEVPVVTHLHGTELLMLEQVDAGADAPGNRGLDWQRRLREWAAGSACIIVAPGNADRAARALHLSGSSLTMLPNGYDPRHFFPQDVRPQEVWRRLLVDEPKGWIPGRAPGSIAYDQDAADRIGDTTVLVYLGRFTAVKRTTMLLEAFKYITQNAGSPVSMVMVGGYPGEWQGEHPADAIDRLQLDNVFLAGWREHTELSAILAAADLLILPSQRESFGQVIVEAMACGVPVVAANSFGPRQIIRDGQTGWLFPVDSKADLVAAVNDAVCHPLERKRRGALARRAVEAYSWARIGSRIESIVRSTAERSLTDRQ